MSKFYPKGSVSAKAQPIRLAYASEALPNLGNAISSASYLHLEMGISKDNQKYWENGSISWFRMEDIRENGHILKDAIQKVTSEAVKGAGLFPANSFILSTTATIGEHAWIIADSLENQ